MEELWNFSGRRVIDCYKFCGIFCGLLEDRNVKNNAEVEGLVSKVSEGSLKILAGPFVISNKNSIVLVRWG